MNTLSENNHYIQINEKVSKNKDNVEIFLKNIYSYFYKKVNNTKYVKYPYLSVTPSFSQGSNSQNSFFALT